MYSMLIECSAWFAFFISRNSLACRDARTNNKAITIPSSSFPATEFLLSQHRIDIIMNTLDFKEERSDNDTTNLSSAIKTIPSAMAQSIKQCEGFAKAADALLPASQSQRAESKVDSVKVSWDLW